MNLNLPFEVQRTLVDFSICVKQLNFLYSKYNLGSKYRFFCKSIIYGEHSLSCHIIEKVFSISFLNEAIRQVGGVIIKTGWIVPTRSSLSVH